MFIDLRERERDMNQLLSMYVPWLGIEPTTFFWCTRQCFNQQPPGQGIGQIFNYSELYFLLEDGPAF